MGTAVPCPVHCPFYPESGFSGVLAGWSPPPVSGDQEVTVGGTATLSGARLHCVCALAETNSFAPMALFGLGLGGYKYR
jgi:hypothetical protein